MPNEGFAFGPRADPKNCLTWKGMCKACGKIRKNGSGLFCSNFSRKREVSPPCVNVWCGGCYHQAPEDPFHILEIECRDQDEMPFENIADDEFRSGRDGDHLMGTPFEWDLCHFQNLAKRNPNFDSPCDVFQLVCI
jgi:hypothetical protein